MHPLHAELTAQMITQDRLRRAATARRLRALTPCPPALRERVGTTLIRLGGRLQQRRPTTAPRTASC